MKIAISFNFYPLEKIYKEINGGKIFPKHHLWGYDYLINRYQVVQPYVDDKRCYSIQEKVFGKNYNQEKKLAKLKSEDLLYSPFLFDCYYSCLIFLF